MSDPPLEAAVPENPSLRRRRHRHHPVADHPPGPPPRKILEQFPEIDGLDFGECLGFGHFSHVYEGVYEFECPVAIKVIERGSDSFIEKEIGLLRSLRGLPHIVQLYEVINCENTLLIFELFKGISFEDFFADVTLTRFRFVLRCLFEALDAAHTANVVHLDVKLGNVLIAPDWSDVRLIDWGCGAELTDDLPPKAGSRMSRSMEMLLGYPGFRDKADAWAMGALIFSVLCGGDIPWRCDSGWETLVIMAAFFGRKTILHLARKYGSELPEGFKEQVLAAERTRFEDSFAECTRDLQVPELIDLMKQLMNVRLDSRLTAKDALEHPFFARRRRSRTVAAVSSRNPADTI
jgi:serine/threonine protein kinase